MSVIVAATDKSLTTGTKLTTTNATAVYVNTNQKGISTKGVRCFICNTDASARTATVEWFDRTANVSYALYSAYSIAANTTLSIELDALEFAGGVASGTDGDELRVTAGTADTLQVVVITVGDNLTRGS
jgi:hypothetical protein